MLAVLSDRSKITAATTTTCATECCYLERLCSACIPSEYYYALKSGQYMNITAPRHSHSCQTNHISRLSVCLANNANNTNSSKQYKF